VLGSHNSIGFSFRSSVGWVGGLLGSHGASKVRSRARDSTSDTEAEICCKDGEKDGERGCADDLLLLLLVCASCIGNASILAAAIIEAGVLLLGQLRDSGGALVLAASRPLHLPGRSVGHSLLLYSNFFTFSHKLRNLLVLQLLPVRFTRCI
jgi:hypothetical protein